MHCSSSSRCPQARARWPHYPSIRQTLLCDLKVLPAAFFLPFFALPSCFPGRQHRKTGRGAAHALLCQKRFFCRLLLAPTTSLPRFRFPPALDCPLAFFSCFTRFALQTNRPAASTCPACHFSLDLPSPQSHPRHVRQLRRRSASGQVEWTWFVFFSLFFSVFFASFFIMKISLFFRSPSTRLFCPCLLLALLPWLPWFPLLPPIDSRLLPTIALLPWFAALVCRSPHPLPRPSA